MEISFSQLLALGNIPRVHGNGFIQLDLPLGYRLHIWPEEKLDTQKVYTGWHNHRFGFKSTVLVGTLHHIQYGAVIKDNLNGEYQLYKAVVRNKEDTELIISSSGFYKFTDRQSFLLSKGSSYDFLPLKWHESNGIGLTATIMKKTETIDAEPLVACPKNTKPDNNFQRYQFDVNQLWKFISDVFDEIKSISIQENNL